MVKLTESQRMALVDILIVYIRLDEPQEFVDVVRNVTTKTGELLKLMAWGDRDAN